MNNNPPDIPRLRIVWGGISSSTVLFLVVANVLERPSELEPPVLLPALGAAAAATAVASLVVPKLLLKQALRQKKPTETYRGGLAEKAAFRQAALTAYATKMIVGCAMSESVALLGFVLAFKGLELTLAAPFFLVSWLLLASHFPKEEAAVAAAEVEWEIRL